MAYTFSFKASANSLALPNNSRPTFWIKMCIRDRGGGVGSGKDNLYKFKAAFNRNSDLQFFIGKQIFDEDKYQELVTIHSKENPLFNMKSCYFPIYRQFDN